VGLKHNKQMVLKNSKKPERKERVIRCLKEYGALSKTKITYITRIRQHDLMFLLREMIMDGSIIKIKGTITRYMLQQ